MKTAVALITSQSGDELKEWLPYLSSLGPEVPRATFSECLVSPATVTILSLLKDAQAELDNRDCATKYGVDSAGTEHHIATSYVSAGAFSNKVIRWFYATGCDRLILCWPGSAPTLDFVPISEAIHKESGVEALCVYRKVEYGQTIPVGSYKITTPKKASGLNVVCLSVTLRCLLTVGGFSVQLGRHGDERMDLVSRIWAKESQSGIYHGVCAENFPIIGKSEISDETLQAAQLHEESRPKTSLLDLGLYRYPELYDDMRAGGAGREGIKINSLVGYSLIY